MFRLPCWFHFFYFNFFLLLVLTFLTCEHRYTGHDMPKSHERFAAYAAELLSKLPDNAFNAVNVVAPDPSVVRTVYFRVCLY